MAKIDFHKVERYFDSGMAEMEIEQLLYLAEIASTLGIVQEEESPKQRKSPEQIKHERAMLLINTKREIKFMASVRRDLINELGIDRAMAKKLFEDPSNVGDKEAEEIQKIRDKVRSFRDEIRKSLMDAEVEETIDQKIKESKYKRFNIRDHWLPLE
ncbi:MAG: hypothetical protein K940chlam3_00191 [Chlamydiae bacterium]|nr:hypothetical protein [Chlamydiota bacterium]